MDECISAAPQIHNAYHTLTISSCKLRLICRTKLRSEVTGENSDVLWLLSLRTFDNNDDDDGSKGTCLKEVPWKILEELPSCSAGSPMVCRVLGCSFQGGQRFWGRAFW